MKGGSRSDRLCNSIHSLGIDSVIVEWRMNEYDVSVYKKESRKDSEGNPWFRDFPTRMNSYNHTALITIHLAHILWQDNYQSVRTMNIKRAIKKAEKKLKLPVSEFRLVGIHIAGTFTLKRKTLDYLPTLKIPSRYKSKLIEGLLGNNISLYLNSRQRGLNSDITRIIYEKIFQTTRPERLYLKLDSNCEFIDIYAKFLVLAMYISLLN